MSSTTTVTISRAPVRRRPRPDSPNWDRLLFSAKEAAYKAWFRLTGEWLDHEEAEIVFDPQDGTFTALLSRDGLIMDGRKLRRPHGRRAGSKGFWWPPWSWIQRKPASAYDFQAKIGRA